MSFDVYSIMKRFSISAVTILFAALLCSSAQTKKDDVILDNAGFRLVISSNAVAKSLKIKGTGEEMLKKGQNIPLFTVTQERPFDNEVKLENPNTRTTYRANKLRMSGDTLFVGFETALYEAIIKLERGDGYLTFELLGFNCDRSKFYKNLSLDVPPVSSFRLLQLPVRERKNFGDWLNVMWDNRSAICVAACDPYEEIWHEERDGFRLLTADLYNSIKLKGGKVALISGSSQENFLKAMDRFEEDMGLPRGVQSRRSPLLNRSIYWVRNATPQDIDEHIRIAKKAGFELMLFYFPCFIKSNGLALLGDYDLRDEYPNGYDDIRSMIEKLKAAGIHPGFHTLQTNIGCRSRYVTPVVDHRLNVKMQFTLKKEVAKEGDITELYVEENPTMAPTVKGCRVLTFGGEAFSYESFTTERPYKFCGVKRCHYNTYPVRHPAGEIGGILDISEFGASSIYLDQNSDLQDEIAEKIAAIYDGGFEFVYLDGSEGVGPPCGINVALSQYRVVSKFKTPPVFVEGAAKSHFSWHFQAGANAFDVFPPRVFEEMILKYPYREAKRMQKDFTRVDFGWWGIFPDTTPAMWDFAESKAVEYDCPVTVQMDLDRLKRNPHSEELLEVLKKWEDYRRAAP